MRYVDFLWYCSQAQDAKIQQLAKDLSQLEGLQLTKRIEDLHACTDADADLAAGFDTVSCCSLPVIQSNWAHMLAPYHPAGRHAAHGTCAAAANDD